MLVKTDSTQAPIKERDLVELTKHQNLAAEAAHEAREIAPLLPDAPGGMDVTNKEQRMGRPLSAWTIQQKLQKVAPFLYFEKSNKDPSKIGIYIRSNVRSPELYKGDLQFVCGMEAGINSEFSVIEAEAKPVPDANTDSGERMQFGMAREIRGWRTVLARLLKWRIISAYDVEKLFAVSLGRDSSRWQQVLNGSMELFSHETENINVRRDPEPSTEEARTPEPSTASGDDRGPERVLEGVRAGTKKAHSHRTGEIGRGRTADGATAQADDPARDRRDGAKG